VHHPISNENTNTKKEKSRLDDSVGVIPGTRTGRAIIDFKELSQGSQPFSSFCIQTWCIFVVAQGEEINISHENAHNESTNRGDK